MDLALLRETLGPQILSLKDSVTHAALPQLCESLGLPLTDVEGSKRDRMLASWEALADEDLPNVAAQFLRRHYVNSSIRNVIQDILWSDEYCPHIPKRYRRELAHSLEKQELYIDARRFDELLEMLWDLGTDIFLGRTAHGLHSEIARHVHQNNDWNAEMLFDKLDAFDASDKRFALFIEGLASADVRPNEAAQRAFVECANTALKKCSVELRETGSADGYPVFTIESLQNVTRGKPKNLIFASPVKPDIRFKDAIDNDIEIVTNADLVLVYDRPIGPEGLRWQDLLDWWVESEQITDLDLAKRSLYKRLLSSLPAQSPPQILLFKAFYEGFASAIPRLPVLLPEVWLHWDPKTVQQRGRDALLRFRMDFLLLLPHGVRIVIEVDGKQHYAREDGMADVQRYGQMVAADRDLKLAGYEVFRFGAAELGTGDAKVKVKKFFETLFKLYRIHY